MVNKIAIVGVGGIGGLLSHMLTLWVWIQARQAEEPTRVLLVDGGTYTNQSDEVFTRPGYKVDVLAEMLQSTYSGLLIEPVPCFVGIATGPRAIATSTLFELGYVVFAAVDNHASRKLLSDAAAAVSSATLIAGGNDGGPNGIVQVYIRRDDSDLTPPLTSGHPYIAHPTDLSPLDALPQPGQSCEARIRSGDQQPSTMFLCAAHMLAAYSTILQLEQRGCLEQFPYVDLYFNAASGKTRLETVPAPSEPLVLSRSAARSSK